MEAQERRLEAYVGSDLKRRQSRSLIGQWRWRDDPERLAVWGV